MRTLAMFLCTILASCSAPEGDFGAGSASDEDVLGKARLIHKRVLTIDTHADIPFNFATEEVDPGLRSDRQIDLPKMEEGGLDAAFFIVYVGQTERSSQNYDKAQADAMVKFEAIHRMVTDLYPERIELAKSVADVRRIHAAGKLVSCIGIENGFVIGKDLSLLSKYHGLGARYITLTHGGHNDIADSSTPKESLGDQESEHGGISPFGREVIAEMNRLGIMVDVSHISKQAMLEAAELSGAPVIASHSSTRALCDHPRNMDDEQLLALKENGGVVQTVALRAFVKQPPPERGEAELRIREEFSLPANGERVESLSPSQQQDYERRMEELDGRWPRANVQDFVDHIDYAVQLIGIDHVGISSDFDGGGGVDGWNDASESENVTLELVRRGYSEAEIAQLWGGNFLRVWSEVEQFAAQLQHP